MLIMAFEDESDSSSGSGLKTCGVCVALLENDFESCSLIQPETLNSEDSGQWESVECKPMSILSMITAVFQFPFNQVSGKSLGSLEKMESWVQDQSPVLACGRCSKTIGDFYSTFMQLQLLIHEASKLSDVLKEWTKVVITGMKEEVNFEKEKNVRCSLKRKRKDVIGIRGENSALMQDISDGEALSGSEDDTPITRRRTSTRIKLAKVKLEVMPSSDHEDFESLGQDNDKSDSDYENDSKSFKRKTKKKKKTNAPQKRRKQRINVRGEAQNTFKKVKVVVTESFKEKEHDTSLSFESLPEKFCSSDTTSVAIPQKNTENRAESEEDDWMPSEVDNFSESDADDDENYNPSPTRRISNSSQKVKTPKAISSSAAENAKVADPENKSKSTNRNEETIRKNQRESTVTSQTQCLCTVCKQTFSSVKILSRHVTSDHDASFPESSSNEVQTAREEGTENPSFTTFFGCGHCSKTFFKPYSLRKHLYCHLEATLPCSECGKLFKKTEFLTQHMRTVHAPVGMKPVRRRCLCPECGKSMRRYNLAVHMKIHRGDRPFKCETCGKGFPTQYTLKEHMKTHSADRPFCCSVCGMRYKQACQLKEHEQTHQENVPKPYVCFFPDCGKSFLRKRTLKSHEVTHRPERDHACHICGATFKLRYAVTKHIKKVHMKKPKADDSKTQVKEKVAESHICPECGKVFQQKRNLGVHFRLVHERDFGENSCQCETCGKTFRTPSYLKNHMETHRTDRPFCCSICGFAFKRQRDLKGHEKIHDNSAEKPFVCSFPNCNWAFKQNKALRKHERNHIATKDHACHICGTAFKRKSNLRQHIDNDKVHGKLAGDRDGLLEVEENA